jgi:hypothetical protein
MNKRKSAPVLSEVLQLRETLASIEKVIVSPILASILWLRTMGPPGNVPDPMEYSEITSGGSKYPKSFAVTVNLTFVPFGSPVETTRYVALALYAAALVVE